MCAVVKHCRNLAGYLSEGILADDGEDHAGRAHVLLGTAVYHGILADIHRAAHDVG